MPKSNPQSPVTPARTGSQNQFLILALTALVLNPTPLESAQQNFSSANHLFSASAVPIFQRDCAILI